MDLGAHRRSLFACLDDSIQQLNVTRFIVNICVSIVQKVVFLMQEVAEPLKVHNFFLFFKIDQQVTDRHLQLVIFSWMFRNQSYKKFPEVCKANKINACDGWADGYTNLSIFLQLFHQLWFER